MRLKRNKTEVVGERKVAVQKIGGWINFLIGRVRVVIGVMALMIFNGVCVLAMAYSQCGSKTSSPPL